MIGLGETWKNNYFIGIWGKNPWPFVLKYTFGLLSYNEGGNILELFKKNDLNSYFLIKNMITIKIKKEMFVFIAAVTNTFF